MLLLLAGCGGREGRPAAAPVTEKRSGDLGKAEMLSAEIRMGAGDLTVEPGERGKAEAEFLYTPNAVVPQFRLDNTTFRARLVVDQAKPDIGMGDVENRWRVKLPEAVATDLEVNMGAGEAKLRLGALDLRKVSMRLGAGRVEADFSGEPKRDYEVEIQGGVGECVVTLPKSAGLRAEAQGGIGAIEVEGLEKHGDVWESVGFSEAKVKVRLKAKGGVGRIVIRAR